MSTTALLVHGGGVGGWMWRPLADELGDDLELLAPDLPGHGRGATDDYLDHQSATAQLAELIREKAPTGLHVVGFSLGAQLAIRLASEFPELVRSVVVVSAETIPAQMPRTTLSLLRWTYPLARIGWFARAQARQLGIPEHLLGEYLQTSRELTRDTLMNSVRENIEFSLPEAWVRYENPAVIVVGERERKLMRDSARLAHEALDGSELVVVPGAGHDVPFTQPDVLAKIIRRAIASAR